MNKLYVYKDGLALILDDNNNQRTINYYDNLDEVLVNEDLIETMENEIKNLENEISQFKDKPKKSKLFKILLPFLIFTFLPLIATPIFGRLYGINNVVDTTLFGPMNLSDLLAISASSLLTIPGALFSKMEYSSQKDREKTKNGKKVQLESLKKELDEQKEYLNELKKNKTNSNEKDDIHVKMIDSSNQLENLNNFSSLCFDLGYNEDKYFKYYQDGNLDKCLKNRTNDTGIEYANEYFKEKAPSLSKMKKKNHTK